MKAKSLALTLALLDQGHTLSDVEEIIPLMQKEKKERAASLGNASNYIASTSDARMPAYETMRVAMVSASARLQRPITTKELREEIDALYLSKPIAENTIKVYLVKYVGQLWERTCHGMYTPI